MLTGSPGGVERPRRWPPTLPDAEVKERVELYPCCYSSGTLWPVIGWILPCIQKLSVSYIY